MSHFFSRNRSHSERSASPSIGGDFLPDATAVSRRDALKGLLAAAGAAVLFANPITVSAVPQASQETLDALDDAQEAYDQTQQQLDELASQFEDLSRQQSDTLNQIEDVQLQIDDTQAKIDDTEEAISDKQDEIDAKQEELEEKQAYLARRVASSYKTGGSSALTLLLNASSFNELISNAYYLDKMNESDQKAIQVVEDIQAELAREKAELEQQKAELEQQQATLEQQRSELETLNAQQAAQLQEMQNKKDEVQQVLDGLDQQVRDLMAQRDSEILAAAQAEEEARRQAEQAAQAGSSNVVLPERGSGQDYAAASAAQKRVVNSCYYTSSPGAGYCARWVSLVFQNAGYGYPGGNACDMYARWCTSSSKADLQVGMIIAVSTYNRNTAGRLYGHVGIYIGDNKIMENIGSINTNTLDAWINYYGTTVTPRWGWARGINLAAQS